MALWMEILISALLVLAGLFLGTLAMLNILGISRIAGHPQGSRVELRGVFQCVAFEVGLVSHKHSQRSLRIAGVEPETGIEPVTYALRVRRSTD